MASDVIELYRHLSLQCNRVLYNRLTCSKIPFSTSLAFNIVNVIFQLFLTKGGVTECLYMYFTPGYHGNHSVHTPPPS